MNSKLLPYALDFTSFLLQKIKQKDKIKTIILFGSVARGEDDSTSDIDLFIDVVGKKCAKVRKRAAFSKTGLQKTAQQLDFAVVQGENAVEKECAAILDSFLSSTKYQHYWKLFGIKNDLKLHVGRLNAWKELHPSLIADGITLYGKYAPQVNEGKHAVFFVWENIHPNTKRVLFNKQLLGYTQNKKHYKGLLQKYEGERLGKGSILIPLEYGSVVHRHFKKYKISVKIKKVLLY